MTPAVCEQPLHEAGHTKEPDHMREPEEKTLAFHGASTHETQWANSSRRELAHPFRERHGAVGGWTRQESGLCPILAPPAQAVLLPAAANSSRRRWVYS